VDDLFAPPGSEWRSVSPALARLRRTVLVGFAVVLLVAVVLVRGMAGLPAWLLAVAVVVVLAAAGLGWVQIGRNARSWGYAERDDDLYIKHGVMFRGLVAVPYGRMQYVDVNAGPLEQLFGVASVHLHTASPGTSARLPGLPKEEAARLRDRLTALGENRAEGL
jgi:membrane protein YdbS with pleckstrin-like domain